MPPLEVATVLVDHGSHHGAHRERSLAARIRRVVEDLADCRETEPGVVFDPMVADRT
jgi:hypothetical protein